ncbi:MAG: hypothetical protein WA966_08705 [Ornithinimicrobium sp.]
MTAPPPVHRTDQESVLITATPHVDRDQAARRRRRTTVVAGGLLLTLLLATAGYILGASRSSDVRAEAVVLVTPLVGNPFSPDGQGEDLLNLQSEAQLVNSDAVATLVARRGGTAPTPEGLLEGLSVEVPPNTQILTIAYSAADAGVASERAQAFATEYLRFRQERAEALLAGRSAGVEGQIEEQNRRLRQLVAQRSSAQTDSRRQLLSTRIDAASAQIAALRGQLAQLAVGSIDPGQVVTPASATSVSSAPPLALAGALLGAIVGALVALLAVRRWWGPRPVRRKDDLLQWGLPVIAEVDADPAAEGAGAPVDDLRDLRAWILAEMAADSGSTLVVLSPLLHGRARSAEALGAVMAHAAVRTIVVQLAAESRGDEGSHGLAALLRHDLDLDQVLVAADDDLWLLPHGDRAEGGGELAATPGLRRVLDECAARADLVVVAGPPLHGPEGIALVERADLLLVEVDEAVRADPGASSAATAVVEAARSVGTRARAVWIRRSELGG